MKKIIGAVKAIASAFNDLINFIQLIFKFIGNLIQQLLYLFKYLGRAISISLDFILTFPPWLGIFATITISVCVLYIILGRRSGGNN